MVPERRFSPSHLHPIIGEALSSDSLAQYYEKFLSSSEGLNQHEWAKAHHCFETSLLPFDKFGTTPLSKPIEAWVIANYDGRNTLHSPISLSHLLAAMSDFSLNGPLHEQHNLLHNYLLPLALHSKLELPLCAGPYRELCELMYHWCLVEDHWLTQHAHA